ncbi:MAG: GIY-YIG nuclease family protein [Chitinophagaceae bacterium]
MQSYKNHQIKYGGCVYIVTNQYNKVLYTGVTAELRARISEHKTKFYPKSLLLNIIVIK